MVEVIIKGEVHASRGDFKAERELLSEGVDTLVIEGEEDEAKFGWKHGWLGVALLIFRHLFRSFVYTDHETLVNIAEGQGANVIYTRETDAELLENSHRLVIGTAFVLFYSLIFASFYFGDIQNNVIVGGGTLLLSGLVPILLLRIYEMRKSEQNRDQKIAEKIEEAVAGGGRVVAIMGDEHAKNVPDYLPNHIDPQVEDPEYGVISYRMGRDLFLPMVRMVGMMAIVYPVFLAGFRVSLSFLT